MRQVIVWVCACAPGICGPVGTTPMLVSLKYNIFVLHFTFVKYY